MGMQNFSLRSIGSYLQENIYYIPDYQREYSWDVDNEIEDFWLDLENLVKEDRSQHFFGQVVIHNSLEENKKYIIDGQQRSSTSVIFLCVLNKLFDDLYMKYGHRRCKHRTEDIRTKYIGRWEEEENELRLHLGKIDREYFMRYVQIGEIYEEDVSILESHIRIKDSYNFFMNKFQDKINYFENIEDKYRELHKYYSKFIDGFTVIYVETDDINEAFIIFETLNSRGKDLETSDLLKNHLFRISGHSIDSIKNKWQNMIDILGNINTTRYIRHYWNSRDHFIREKDLYKKIREAIKTPKECEKIVSNLVDLSEVYKAMVNANDESYFSDLELKQILCNLKTIKASSFYPIILSMKNMNFNEQEIKEVAKSIENLIVRNCVVAGKVANKYERLFANIAHCVYKKDYVKVQNIKDIILKDTIKDEEFKMAFSSFRCNSKPVIRYLLNSINKLNKETEIINDNKRIHIEHIMPQNNNNWNIDKDIHEEFLWKFGNLTLLGSEYNKSVSNKNFEEKKKVYNNSTILITREISNYDKWDENMIQKRQERLAELALKVWSIA